MKKKSYYDAVANKANAKLDRLIKQTGYDANQTDIASIYRT